MAADGEPYDGPSAAQLVSQLHAENAQLRAEIGHLRAVLEAIHLIVRRWEALHPDV
jgi:hypothetical protein